MTMDWNSYIQYPKISIADIELCCLHYKNCEEAIEAWERRKKRINFSNVFIVGNSWNLHEQESYIRRLCVNKLYPTVCFTYQEYPELSNAITLQGDFFGLTTEAC